MDAKIVSFKSSENLGIVQFSTPDVNSVSFTSGKAAIRDGILKVSEIYESGSKIRVKNKSNSPVAILNGDFLTGLYRNEILNTSVLLPAKSVTEIKVSLPDQIRWDQNSGYVYRIPHVRARNLTSAEIWAIRRRLGVQKKLTQLELWPRVRKEKKKVDYKLYLPLEVEWDIYREKCKKPDELAEDFAPNCEANGIAVFIRNKLLNVEIFGRQDIYNEYFPNLRKKAALSATRIFTRKVPLGYSEAKYKTLTFLDRINESGFIRQPGIGIGEERRFEIKEISGFELNYKTYLIHLSALNIETETKNKKNIPEKKYF